jgi:hypothetical protein
VVLPSNTPDKISTWSASRRCVNFENGGDGVFLLTAEQVFVFNEQFKAVLR